MGLTANIFIEGKEIWKGETFKWFHLLVSYYLPQIVFLCLKFGFTFLIKLRLILFCCKYKGKCTTSLFLNCGVVYPFLWTESFNSKIQIQFQSKSLHIHLLPSFQSLWKFGRTKSLYMNFVILYRVLFELIWRDYFRFISIKYGNRLFHSGNMRIFHVSLCYL